MPGLIAKGLSCVAGLSVAAVSLAQQSGAGNTSSSSEPLQEVVVTGLRASLEKSLDIKRDAPVVLDSINATELGRFPDADVADSLEHLPGITISRTTGGEGQKVTVRGFGPQYNIVTLNNRILATDDDARDLAFDVLPSEIISGADVLKSPQASALEGSIGGTVNLRTASPFDNRGLHAGIHAEGDYNSMSSLWGQKYSAFASNTFVDDTVGVLVGLVHSDNKLRTDSLNNNNQTVYGPCAYPFTAACGAPGSTAIVAAPYAIAFGSIYDEKKRDAVSGSLEWRPNSDFKLVADGMFTRLRDPQLGYNQSYYFPYTVDANGAPLWSNPTIVNGLVTGLTAAGFQPEAVNNSINRKVDTQLFGLNGSWDVTSSFNLGFDVYHSRAKRPEGGNDTYATAGLVSPTPNAEDTLIFNDTPHGLPDINVLVPPSQFGLSTCPAGTASSGGSCSYTALMNSRFLNNNNYWSTHYVSLNGFSVDDQIDSGQLNGTLKVNWGPLAQVQFGYVESHREKSRSDVSNDWTNGSGQYGALYNTAGCPIQCGAYSFGSQGFNVLSLLSPPNFMQGAGGSFPGVLPAINMGQLFAFLKSLDGKENPYAPGTVFNFANTLPQVNPFNSYRVTEKTRSFFLQTDWAGERWAGNLGVRVVHTTTTADYAQSVPVSLWTPDASASTVTYNVQYNLSQPTSSNGSYTLALPSLNFSYWVLPHELQFRAGLAETMSRPNLNQLAPNATNGALGGRPELYYSGTAGLKPIKVYQGDLSLEWYYRPRAAVTLAYFEKHVHDDIYTGVTNNIDLGTKLYVGGPPGSSAVTSVRDFVWTVYAPANGNSSTYRGVELTWQEILENGLGAHVQVTHTSSSADAVNTTPPTTASVGLIYEKGPVSLDVNWDYTSHYKSACAVCTEVTGWPVYSDSFQWLTASAHYKFFNNFDVYVEGRNLTNAVVRSYLNNNPLLVWANGQAVGQSSSGVGYGYTAYGRSYMFGAAYRF